MTAPLREDERSTRFRELYEANYERILGYALRRVGHPDALDVVAETFTVAWRRLGRVPDGDEARLWLYGTARRVLANHERGAPRSSDYHHASLARAGRGCARPGPLGASALMAWPTFNFASFAPSLSRNRSKTLVWTKSREPAVQD